MTVNTPNPGPELANERQPVRPPRRSLTPWVLLLPVALLAGGWWMMNREPDEPIQPAVDNAVSAPTPQAKPTATKPAPKPTSNNEALKLTIFVPDDNGILQRRTVTAPDVKPSELPTSPAASFQFVAARAVQLLLKEAPDNFAKGTRLISVKQKPGSNVVEANFNEKFAQPEFWQGSAQTLATTDSIVNTIAAVPDAKQPVRVQILVEGKPVQTLGELDAAEPFEPDMSLVAKG